MLEAPLSKHLRFPRHIQKILDLVVLQEDSILIWVEMLIYISVVERGSSPDGPRRLF